ncbi:hypothetical protein [Mycobacterium sp. ITM-2016-00318]|uniref:hypothetical protein n=1 Tax=Mycobacterium sp. ITM-2016-00318 TaxID=2099693 RepID=UPI000CFA7093|nr:hypothetical protein [Mycobacterium sp. ITM-2016-00318]WNG90643.1 hypothetical protein C6A82_013825 [Mycobacterium sp. ITM-2016-00318]
MLMRRVSAKEKAVNNGLVRAALVAGVASAVAVGSLSGVGPANGTCIGISGINIGSGCTSTFGNFALGLGEGTVATANGSFLNFAIAAGTNVTALAGDPTGFSLGNLALNLGSGVDPRDNVVAAGVFPDGPPGSAGSFNLATNLGGNGGTGDGTPMTIVATGLGSSAINVIGNRNTLTSAGILNNTTNVGLPFGFPNASDSVLTSIGNLSTAFNYQGIFTAGDCAVDCGNFVTAVGPGAIAGAINVVQQIVVQAGPGITLRTPFDPNTGGSTATTLASANKFAPTTLAGGSSNKSGNQLSASSAKSSKQFSSSLKKLSNGVKNAVNGLGKKKQTSTPEKSGGEN